MKEQAIAIARSADDPNQAVNRLREYLQVLVLRSLHDDEAFRPLAFVGGTALRFLHGLPRFSEDSEFSLVSDVGYDGAGWMATVKRQLVLAGFDAEVSWNERLVVHTAWVRLSGLLHEVGAAGRPEQKLAIKVEIDTRPPQGAALERTVLTRYVTFLVQHYDLPSLLAGKLHAALTRPYPKGRDWYDLLWYLSQRPPIEPNLGLLQNALDQTQGPGHADADAWVSLVADRLGALEMPALVRDIQPFLERRADASLLTREHLLSLLRARNARKPLPVPFWPNGRK